MTIYNITAKNKEYIARVPYMRQDGLWKQIGGDFKTPKTGKDQYKNIISSYVYRYI